MSTPKHQIVRTIVDTGLVAIVRTDNADTAARIAEACADGGVSALEITFTVPGAAGVIESLRRRYAPGRLLVGAGTVIDAETARIAILSGAEYIVAPALSAETARLCLRYQVPYLPGAGTIGEIIAGLEAGADIIKVFPGEVLGPAFIKAARGPLPQAPLLPTGGVSIENVHEWIAAGAVAVGVGGHLTAGAQRGDFGAITTMARSFIERIREARAS
ncbi:MAG TPA: bifunctional 2-keto-4-hydroxyglutarate aldolase/2-keto-3-deoxy-6-phosphogluconate aldolase [Vicinamibacterales bacterium]|nr:bifunctional 2-keto-4-hydroxyglutarate aldolase/2-keto-3-deoxy-6-phosphogluconate aldolase [Vicinamibacterales bacterium]